ncbi:MULTISPECIES: transglycosylase family protein [Mammaliicoccus]|uniref:Transglycosylase family protein n=1 Tax=Mammaliicoccus sciuri TaxID=1296 RepID=A0ABT7HY44_MAMSC|nr:MULTISPECIES: transglycosylase family protein [Mammaliicoccus]MCJ0915234.1 transglycosylase family protein [Mammaliicoccus sciuri]MCJ0943542.1 transglycosylase family protein [Mammaliicoccus sciuri]MDL0111983.1 transglycosylase family protein [Mammaliicoccus sciuri]MDL0117069.1 transglycosylase family protein [Mammaliicoccus sciuri]WQJ65527.1 transglycosylase family protein [Mammaliicoccus sciuri]
MKKAFLTSSLAVAIGATGVASTQVADAAEQDVNKEQLAQLAQSNSPELNEHAIQEGAYNINFTLDGFEYNFQSDGHNFTWEYHATNAADSESTQAPVAEQQQPVAEENVAEQTPAPAANNTANEQATQEAPQQVEAPKQETQQTQQTTTQTTQTSTTSSSASEGSSVNVNDHLKLIAQRESGGDLKAVNPTSGAAGKYQFLQSTWDSVAPSEWVGKSPTEAPESVQDAAAVKLYNTAGPSQWVTA